jgi:hypothetical protein
MKETIIERKQTEDRCKEIETALNEIVGTVERYFLIAPFQRIEGLPKVHEAQPAGEQKNRPRTGTVPRARHGTRTPPPAFKDHETSPPQLSRGVTSENFLILNF